MSNAYEPSAYVEGLLNGFGFVDGDLWGGPDNPDPAARAARVQDQVARIVNEHLKANKITQSAFADDVGIPRQRLNRLLKGAWWARLPELEQMLGGCGSSMAQVSWAIGEGHRQSEAIQRVIAAYLHEQLSKVEGNARSGRGRPSTEALQRSADPASGFR